MATQWLAHERYCTAIGTETELLRAAVGAADPERQVPSCPEWTVRDLALHVGRVHRWAAEMVRRRVDSELPDDAEHVPEYAPAGGDAGLDGWLAAGAEQLAAELRAAGPDAPMWTWWREQQAGFWARRMALETVVHRADADLAAGRRFAVEPDLAVDAVEEFLGFVTDPPQPERDPDHAHLLGTGQTLHLHATQDEAGEGAAAGRAEWLIVLGPERLEWRRGHARADVALRGPLPDLLLAFMRRVPPDSARLEVLGDRALLDHWLAHTSFG